MLKRQLLWVLVAWLPSYSYSESIAPYYGTTGNAVTDQSLRWSMGNVLPSPPGLEINGVLYRYTIRKEQEDSVSVHVQNENANGIGYIFRETDDWLPGSLDGTQINKVVPVIPSHRSLWGDGSIEVDGNGSVEDANVLYTYRVDPCYDPQFDPNCPGYQVQVPDVYEFDTSTLYDVTQDDLVSLNRSTDVEEIDEDEEDRLEEERKKQEEEDEKDREGRLEKALAAADNSAMFAQALAQSQMLDSINMATNMNAYYATSIPGGVYQDNTTLVDTKLPENRSGLRNGLAQQILHDRMVEMQYDKK